MFAPAFGSGGGPQFRSSDPQGTYRLHWQYDLVSNEFELTR